MNNLYNRMNALTQEIILLDEGDMMGLNDLYTSVENDYQELAQLSGDESVLLMKRITNLLNAMFKGQLNDFSLFQKYFSEAIGLLKTIIHNKINDIDEVVDLNVLNNQIAFLLTGSDEDPGPVSPSPEPVQPAPEPVQPAPEKGDSTMDMGADEELLNGFFSEALEYIENIEVNVLSLEQSPFERSPIDEIFRAFHTIKGVSGFLNLPDINFIAHETESLLEKVIDEHILMDSEHLDLILDNADLIREIIVTLKANAEGSNLPIPEIDHSIISNLVNYLLSSEKQVVERKKLGEIMVEHDQIDEDTLKDLVEKQDDDEDRKLGELLMDDTKVNAKQVAHALREQRESTVIRSNNGNSPSDWATIKVNSNKLDSLLDMVGELVIADNQVYQSPLIKELTDGKIIKDFNHLNRVVSDLQKLSMSLRMVQMRRTFQKITRLVRDLSLKFNKPVDLVIMGEDTEIDRSVVDDLYEPLVHLIRNSIDHGLESPDERLRKQKNEKGHIYLSACHQGGNVVIEIKDDGQGLDRKAIIRKALDKGLIQDPETLSPKEIDELLFHPGLSTAKELTDVSGRGIGMDIVKKKINHLRGTIDIASEPDKGTQFTLKIPLTMAIIDGMIVSIGDHKYVLPTLHVRHIFKLQPDKYFTIEKKGEMVDVRDHLVPLIRLYHILKVKPRFTRPGDALMVLVENDGQQKCFMIDDILDKQEVVVKSLGEKLRDIQGVSSATILGDGKVGLILDIKGIFDLQEHKEYEKLTEPITDGFI
ncbi:MAG TPA: chemotaxis protein CheA [Spirochaetes bacterium]|nr:chemotaxis protein CheA [Spirochaetota bacterium]